MDDDEYEREDIADVRFVPLIGKEGWESEDSDWQTKPPRVVQSRPAVSLSLPGLIADHVRSTGYSDRTHVPFALEPARSTQAPDFKSGFGAIRLQDG